MNKTDNTTSIQELKDAIRTFREERGWGKSRTPRNMAVSIAVEAAELLEHFQWGEYDERKAGNRQRVGRRTHVLRRTQQYSGY
jgi:hypothetical protein